MPLKEFLSAADRAARLCEQSDHSICGGSRDCERVRGSEEDHFDAGRLLLAHGDQKPSDDWETAALLRLVRESIDGPRARRSRRRTILLTGALARLGERGIGPDMVLRTWLGKLFTVHSLLLTAREWNRLGEPGGEAATFTPWCELLSVQLARNEREVSGLGDLMLELSQGDVRRAADEWCARAAVSHLVDYRVTGYTTTDVEPEDLYLPAGEDATVWLFERLSLTYLSDWSPSSLQWELAYIDDPGRVLGVLRLQEEILAERSVPLENVIGELTQRLVARGVTGDVIEGLSPEELTHRLVKMLRAGKVEDACALAERAFRRAPGDEQAALSLAFCLMVRQPARARQLLEWLSVRWIIDGDSAARSADTVQVDLVTLDIVGQSCTLDEAARLVSGLKVDGWFWDPVDLVAGKETLMEFTTTQSWLARLEELRPLSRDVAEG